MDKAFARCERAVNKAILEYSANVAKTNRRLDERLRRIAALESPPVTEPQRLAA